MKRVILVSIGLVLLIGCGSMRNTSRIVTGTITYNGKPVNRATLYFHPTSGEGKDISTITQEDGTFSVSDIPPGDYKIYVEGTQVPPQAAKGPRIPEGMDPAKAEEMKQKFAKKSGQLAPTISFPPKYKKVGTTNLTCTITGDKQEKLTLEMKD